MVISSGLWCIKCTLPGLAKQGHLTQAIKQFQQAQIQVACLKFDPEARAKRFAAQAKIDQDEALAQEGKISAAVEEFKQALAIDSRFKLNHLEAYAQRLASLSFFNQGVKLAEEGKVDAALAQFQAAQALKPDLEIDAYQWNTLCQKGIDNGQDTWTKVRHRKQFPKILLTVYEVQEAHQ